MWDNIAGLGGAPQIRTESCRKKRDYIQLIHTPIPLMYPHRRIRWAEVSGREQSAQIRERKQRKSSTAVSA